MPSMRSRLSLIHPSAWKGNSANFGCFDSRTLEYRDVRGLRGGEAPWEYLGTKKGTAHTLGGSR